MTRIIWLCMLVTLGCGALPHKPDTSSRRPAVEYTETKNQYFRFNDLKDLLISNNISSIEQALPILNSKYYDYLKFHTLMYGSFSVQASSFEEPRALVFGPEARFIFTFNGRPEQMGGTSIETVEYSDENQSFQFREIAFKKYPGFDINELNLRPDEIAYQNENIIVSKPNPAKCLQCHGQNASPIWQTYFFWPGAYGSNDDQLFMSFDKSSWNPNNEGFFKMTQKPSSQGRRMSLRSGFKDAELEGLVRYATAKPHHPRYKWLPLKIFETAAVRYAKGVPFSDLDFSSQLKTDAEGPTRSNDYLLTKIQHLNSDRLVSRLKHEGLKDAFASPAWEQLFSGAENLKSKSVIPTMAANIHKVISQFNFKGPKPTLQHVQDVLTANLIDEIKMQRERIYRQAENLGKKGIQYQPYISVYNNNRLIPESPPVHREGMEIIQNAREFYSQLLSLKQLTELDKIAIGMETDNQFVNTAVDILLMDRGIDLHDYTTNLRQSSVSFHSGGLTPALQYLGVVGWY